MADRAVSSDDRFEVVPGEPVPAVGDVLALAQLWSARVERVRGRTVWLVDVDGDSPGAERWVFLPAARRGGPERLMRRR